jgi:hypothetical protein
MLMKLVLMTSLWENINFLWYYNRLFCKFYYNVFYRTTVLHFATNIFWVLPKKLIYFGSIATNIFRDNILHQHIKYKILSLIRLMGHKPTFNHIGKNLTNIKVLHKYTKFANYWYTSNYWYQTGSFGRWLKLSK